MFNDKELYYASKIAYFKFTNQIIIDITTKTDSLQNAVINNTTNTNIGAENSDYQKIIDNYHDIANWEIVRIDNYNEKLGIYAITLVPPTSDTAIIAFRGSESADFSDAMHDWAIADFGLFAGELTAQQNTANSIVEEILKDENLKDYNFVLTGHSLGGNLATHCTLMNLTDRIVSCTGFDSPNFVNKNTDKVSPVGVFFITAMPPSSAR